MNECIFDQNQLLDKLFSELQRHHLEGKLASYEQLQKLAPSLTMDEYKVIIARFKNYLNSQSYTQSLSKHMPFINDRLKGELSSLDQKFLSEFSAFLAERDQKFAFAAAQSVMQLEEKCAALEAKLLQSLNEQKEHQDKHNALEAQIAQLKQSNLEQQKQIESMKTSVEVLDFLNSVYTNEVSFSLESIPFNLKLRTDLQELLNRAYGLDSGERAALAALILKANTVVKGAKALGYSLNDLKSEGKKGDGSALSAAKGESAAQEKSEGARVLGEGLNIPPMPDQFKNLEQLGSDNSYIFEEQELDGAVETNPFFKGISGSNSELSQAILKGNSDTVAEDKSHDMLPNVGRGTAKNFDDFLTAVKGSGNHLTDIIAERETKRAQQKDAEKHALQTAQLAALVSKNASAHANAIEQQNKKNSQGENKGDAATSEQALTSAKVEGEASAAALNDGMSEGADKAKVAHAPLPAALHRAAGFEGEVSAASVDLAKSIFDKLAIICADLLATKQSTDVTSFDLENAVDQAIAQKILSPEQRDLLRRLLIKMIYMGRDAMNINDFSASDESLIALLPSVEQKIFARSILSWSASGSSLGEDKPLDSFEEQQDLTNSPTLNKTNLEGSPKSAEPSVANAHGAQDFAHEEPLALLNSSTPKALPRDEGTLIREMSEDFGNDDIAAFTAARVKIESLAPFLNKAGKELKQASKELGSVLKEARLKGEIEKIEDEHSRDVPQSLSTLGISSLKYDNLGNPFNKNAASSGSHNGQASAQASIFNGVSKSSILPSSSASAISSTSSFSFTSLGAKDQGATSSLGSKIIDVDETEEEPTSATSEIASVAKDVLKVASELERATDQKNERRTSLFGGSIFNDPNSGVSVFGVDGLDNSSASNLSGDYSSRGSAANEDGSDLDYDLSDFVTGNVTELDHASSGVKTDLLAGEISSRAQEEQEKRTAALDSLNDSALTSDKALASSILGADTSVLDSTSDRSDLLSKALSSLDDFDKENAHLFADKKDKASVAPNAAALAALNLKAQEQKDAPASSSLNNVPDDVKDDPKSTLISVEHEVSASQEQVAANVAHQNAAESKPAQEALASLNEAVEAKEEAHNDAAQLANDEASDSVPAVEDEITAQEAAQVDAKAKLHSDESKDDQGNDPSVEAQEEVKSEEQSTQAAQEAQVAESPKEDSVKANTAPKSETPANVVINNDVSAVTTKSNKRVFRPSKKLTGEDLNRFNLVVSIINTQLNGRIQSLEKIFITKGQSDNAVLKNMEQYYRSIIDNLCKEWALSSVVKRELFAKMAYDIKHNELSSVEGASKPTIFDAPRPVSSNSFGFAANEAKAKDDEASLDEAEQELSDEPSLSSNEGDNELNLDGVKVISYNDNHELSELDLSKLPESKEEIEAALDAKLRQSSMFLGTFTKAKPTFSIIDGDNGNVPPMGIEGDAIPITSLGALKSHVDYGDDEDSLNFLKALLSSLGYNDKEEAKVTFTSVDNSDAEEVSLNDDSSKLDNHSLSSEHDEPHKSSPHGSSSFSLLEDDVEQGKDPN